MHTAKGYITVEVFFCNIVTYFPYVLFTQFLLQVLRDILHELDDKISSGDLDLMIDEIDADGSGTVDFEGMHKFS